jgi:hypothetical protein
MYCGGLHTYPCVFYINWIQQLRGVLMFVLLVLTLTSSRRSFLYFQGPMNLCYLSVNL